MARWKPYIVFGSGTLREEQRGPRFIRHPAFYASARWKPLDRNSGWSDVAFFGGLATRDEARSIAQRLAEEMGASAHDIHEV